MRTRPDFGNRPQFVGSADDYEWLARWFGYRAHIEPVWRGVGTVLIVLSKNDGPLSAAEVTEFREVLRDFTIVGAVMTVVSVG